MGWLETEKDSEIEAVDCVECIARLHRQRIDVALIIVLNSRSVALFIERV